MMAPCAGCLLIATPMLDDPNFRSSVVYLVEHGRPGSLGFILNRPLDISLGEVWADCPAMLAGMRCCAQGGPVDPGRGLLMHGYEDIPACQCMGEGLFIGGEIEPLRRRALADPELPARGPRLLLGHAGWEHDQLAGEIALGAWIVRPGAARLLLHPAPAEDLWDECVGAGAPPVLPGLN